MQLLKIDKVCNAKFNASFCSKFCPLSKTYVFCEKHYTQPANLQKKGGVYFFQNGVAH